MDRSCGVLMHITSLPSPYGVGSLGSAAFRFADFLKDADQDYWQILPVGPTGYGDSPYQSFSTYAGNPYFIDLDLLCESGLLNKNDILNIDWGKNPQSVDYGKLYKNRFKVLKIAFDNFKLKANRRFNAFCKTEDFWLSDYAFYMAIKTFYNGNPWYEWDNAALRLHDKAALKSYYKDNKNEVDFWKFIQFLFFDQWLKLKKYVNRKQIKFIGDIPFYVSGDSSDVWANRSLFRFDDDNMQSCYAGVPPDYFSKDGQFWGNPIYDWASLKKDNYKWWVNRLKHTFRLYDVVRIDHFRGFEAYYVIERGAKTAAKGAWEKGPGSEFFGIVTAELGEMPVIAEDLGFLTPEVTEMRIKAGYPGMKILQFAFDGNAKNDYLPHNYERNCVVYTGTHDNDTLKGWLNSVSKKELKYTVDYAALTRREGYAWGILRLMYSSVADLAIAQMQDFLDLPASARMNLPSTIGKNWKWRIKSQACTHELAAKIKRMVKLYGR